MTTSSGRPGADWRHGEFPAGALQPHTWSPPSRGGSVFAKDADPSRASTPTSVDARGPLSFTLRPHTLLQHLQNSHCLTLPTLTTLTLSYCSPYTPGLIAPCSTRHTHACPPDRPGASGVGYLAAGGWGCALHGGGQEVRHWTKRQPTKVQQPRREEGSQEEKIEDQSRSWEVRGSRQEIQNIATRSSDKVPRPGNSPSACCRPPKQGGHP